MTRRPNESGYAMVWILVVMALLVAAFTGARFADDDRPPSSASNLVFAAGLGIAALGLFAEAKRNLYAFSGFMTVVGFVTGMITGAVALMGSGPHPVAAAVAVLSVLTVIACVVFLVRTEYGREKIPNILRQQFHRSRIYEVDGVQLVPGQSQTEVNAGEQFEIRVVAQNCWDKERTLMFRLKSATRISTNKAGVKFPSEGKVTLPPGAVAALTIPVVAEPGAKGRYRLIASPKVSGEDGRRVRRWRAQAWPTHIPAWLTLLLAAGGVLGGQGHVLLAWGGSELKVRVHPANQPAVGTTTPLDVQTEIVWQPGPGELVGKAVA
jgi:hypothetical protein